MTSSAPSTGDTFVPMRHPRPLTAADLHMQLEKEQEAVVNRLTRELTSLRQQSASVVSTTSSTSTGLADATDHGANHLFSGPSHPTPSRRHHRSSSSASTRSINTSATTASGVSGSTAGWTTAGVAGSVVSGMAPSTSGMPVGGTSQASAERVRDGLSRQNSVASSSRRSGTSSPSLSSSFQHGDPFPHFYSNRHSGIAQHPPSSSHGPNSGAAAARPEYSARSPSISSAAATARYEEVTLHRSELDAVKHENEVLRRRIKELERSLRSRQGVEGGRERSESASTSASVPGGGVSLGLGRDREKEDGEHDAVQVGESARSGGGR
ncbi:MAG: hypothetical protein M1836_002233 [Candelina mexicana]|nr:MAG: hypothetical protein M1836_002233 [Candelina mexicana]